MRETQIYHDMFNSLLPGLKLELPIFTTALPIPGHERVKEPHIIQKQVMKIHKYTWISVLL